MRYFLGLLAFIAFIVLVVVIITHRGPKSTTTLTGSPKIVKLTDYISKNSEVRYTDDGQINGEELHRVIQINVTPSQRTMTVFRGYDQEILKQQTYPNDANAYDSFLHALNLLNYTKEKSGVKQKDERGVCPTGQRFIYQLRESGEDITRLWSTSCNSAQGTYGGLSPSTVRTLFQRQIPDYNKLVSDVTL